MSLTAPILDASRGPILTSATMLGARMRAFGAGGATASTAWPSNAAAYLIPFLVSTPMTYTRAFFVAGTSPGTTNFDIGIYSDAFRLIRSLGATAAVNTTDLVNPAGGGAFTTPVTLTRGRYYLAMSAASTTLTVRAVVSPTNQMLRAVGMLRGATSHPLPSTFTPLSMGALVIVPMVGLMTTADVVI